MTPTPAPQASRICEFCDTTITTAAPCFTKEMASDCSERKKMLRKKKAPQASPEVDYTAVPEHTLPETLGADGAKWAAAFQQIVMNRLIPIDEGLMIGWFANAIEAACQARSISHASTPTVTEVAEIERRHADEERWLDTPSDGVADGIQRLLQHGEQAHADRARLLQIIRSTAGTQEPESRT